MIVDCVFQTTHYSRVRLSLLATWRSTIQPIRRKGISCTRWNHPNMIEYVRYEFEKNSFLLVFTSPVGAQLTIPFRSSSQLCRGRQWLETRFDQGKTHCWQYGWRQLELLGDLTYTAKELDVASWRGNLTHINVWFKQQLKAGDLVLYTIYRWRNPHAKRPDTYSSTHYTEFERPQILDIGWWRWVGTNYSPGY